MAARRSASERNQQAVDGGMWHQEEICRRLARWRVDPVGWGLARSLFGAEMLSDARVIEPRRVLDSIAKPDLAARWISLHGEAQTAFVSAKLIASQPGASLSRPVHHAGRVRFEVAQSHGLLPEDPIVAGWILEHFIDGEPLSARPAHEAERALEHFREAWPRVALAALAGQDEPRAQWLLVSMAQWPGTPELFLGDAAYVPVAERRQQEEADRAAAEERAARGDPEPDDEEEPIDPDARPRLVETRLISVQRAAELIASEPPTLSRPRETQVGSIGSRLMLVQRGQARSLGPQRDVQVKICAAALFEAAGPLPTPTAPRQP
jgi:hypothetical protein